MGGVPPGVSDVALIDHNVTVTGSELSDQCAVGGNSAGSLTVLPGGSLGVINGMGLGNGGEAGTLVIEGTGALTTEVLIIGMSISPGTLIIRPTANGSGGLTAIIVNSSLDVDFGNSILELDTSLYTPSLSDSWTAANYGSLSGGFWHKNAPAGFAISTNVARGGSPLIVTVTAVPSGLPLATALTLTLTALVLTLLGMFAVRRVRRQRG